MVCLCQHYDDLSGEGVTMEVMGDGEVTPLSAIRLYKMEVPPSMNGSLYLTINNLLKDK